MTKTKYILLLCLLAAPATSLREGVLRNNGEDVPGAAFLFPQISSDFSDLDARDAHNQPIRSLQATQELTTLFRENLVNLMVFVNPHAITQALNWLESFSHLFKDMILSRLTVAFDSFSEAIFTPNRRFVHNVDKLWISISVGIFLGFFLVSTFCLKNSPLTVPRRC